jgi:ribosomal protein S8
MHIVKKLKATLSEIENAMERWHHGRDNDDEALEEINKIMYEAGYLKWFNEKQ